MRSDGFLRRNGRLPWRDYARLSYSSRHTEQTKDNRIKIPLSQRSREA